MLDLAFILNYLLTKSKILNELFRLLLAKTLLNVMQKFEQWNTKYCNDSYWSANISISNLYSRFASFNVYSTEGFEYTLWNILAIEGLEKRLLFQLGPRAKLFQLCSNLEKIIKHIPQEISLFIYHKALAALLLHLAKLEDKSESLAHQIKGIKNYCVESLKLFANATLKGMQTIRKQAELCFLCSVIDQTLGFCNKNPTIYNNTFELWSFQIISYKELGRNPSELETLIMDFSLSRIPNINESFPIMKAVIKTYYKEFYLKWIAKVKAIAQNNLKDISKELYEELDNNKQ